MYSVYAISSLNRNYIYLGLTANLEARLHRHNSGLERTTQPYAPFKLLHKEEFATRAEARIPLSSYKSGSGKEYLRDIQK